MPYLMAEDAARAGVPCHVVSPRARSLHVVSGSSRRMRERLYWGSITAPKGLVCWRRRRPAGAVRVGTGRRRIQSAPKPLAALLLRPLHVVLLPGGLHVPARAPATRVPLDRPLIAAFGVHRLDVRVDVLPRVEPDLRPAAGPGPLTVPAGAELAAVVPVVVDRWRRRPAAHASQAPYRALAATSVPSSSSVMAKSLKTCGATCRSTRRHATAPSRISTSAASVARIAMKCRHAR